jgi:hypothetical protein
MTMVARLLESHPLLLLLLLPIWSRYSRRDQLMFPDH